MVSKFQAAIKGTRQNNRDLADGGEIDLGQVQKRKIIPPKMTR
jgi:hypothetical protein